MVVTDNPSGTGVPSLVGLRLDKAMAAVAGDRAAEPLPGVVDENGELVDPTQDSDSWTIVSQDPEQLLTFDHPEDITLTVRHDG
jgi:beta-lactam-binding protein with PASTA domain